MVAVGYKIQLYGPLALGLGEFLKTDLNLFLFQIKCLFGINECFQVKTPASHAPRHGCFVSSTAILNQCDIFYRRFVQHMVLSGPNVGYVHMVPIKSMN